MAVETGETHLCVTDTWSRSIVQPQLQIKTGRRCFTLAGRVLRCDWSTVTSSPLLCVCVCVPDPGRHHEQRNHHPEHRQRQTGPGRLQAQVSNTRLNSDQRSGSEKRKSIQVRSV